MRKVKDLAVATGSYTDGQGNTKKRYANVGAVMEGDNGQFLFINRHINFAGLPFKEGSESVIVSMFDLREKDGQGGGSQGGGGGYGGGGSSQGRQQQNRQSDLDDDVPF